MLSASCAASRHLLVMVTLPQLAPTRRIRWTSDFNFWKAPNFWREMEKSNFQAASNTFCLAGVNLQMIDADFPIFIGLNRNHGFRGRLNPTKHVPQTMTESHTKKWHESDFKSLTPKEPTQSYPLNHTKTPHGSFFKPGLHELITKEETFYLRSY